MNDEQKDTFDHAMLQLLDLSNKTRARLRAMDEAHHCLKFLLVAVEEGSKERIALNLSQLLPILDEDDWLFDVLGGKTTKLIHNLIQETGIKELKNGHACPAGGTTDER